MLDKEREKTQRVLSKMVDTQLEKLDESLQNYD